MPKLRDAQQETKSRHHIENNPATAFLVRDPKDWPWCSARLRDEFGRCICNGARLSPAGTRRNLQFSEASAFARLLRLRRAALRRCS
jgi:hypothetical protein